MAITTDYPVETPVTRWRAFKRRQRDAGELAAKRSTNARPTQSGAVDHEHLKQLGIRLADRHRITSGRTRRNLLRRLDASAQALSAAHRLLGRSVAAGAEVAVAATWLLDNHYLLQNQIAAARRGLSRKCDRGLARLSDGRRVPRVYDIALELIAYCDGQLDEPCVERFVGAYQTISPLTLCELWALPTMLKIAVIENVGRTALRTGWRRQDGERGKCWGERLSDVPTCDESQRQRVFDEMVSCERPLSPSFVCGLAGRLSTDNPAAGQLREYLAARGDTLESVGDAEAREDAGDAGSFKHAIATLRLIDGVVWHRFVERQSAVGSVLQQDPAGAYAAMDAGGRDYYRQVIQRLALRSRLSEAAVAERAIDLAAAADPDVPRQSHVGYYLVDEGRSKLEVAIGCRLAILDRAARMAARRPLVCYVAAISAIWALLMVGVVTAVWYAVPVTPATAALLLSLFGGVASQFAVSMVNWLSTLFIPTRPTMRLDFSTGIPANCATLVVVPSMLSSVGGARDLARQLELRYLGNRDESLRYALLTDLPDAKQQSLPSDAGPLTVAAEEIEKLNKKYCQASRTAFYLLHRSRRWNAAERCWMGEERKRGKLDALNRLLRTGDDADFHVTVGDLDALRSVRYVITLDTDTRLPPFVARQLVGCIAHPLNAPQVDPRTRTVSAGHAILQPRVGATIVDARRTTFSVLAAGDAGIDPYTRQTSDVYHDLFGRGSFIGKGIYDVDAFAAALEARFPPNRVLSHDLIEGCFARSGLINDVELFESVPCRLLTDMNRRHRWIRGDWQIASWLWRRVPGEKGRAANPLDALSRWKIFDNLRRSLMPPCLLAFLIAGWIIAPSLALAWALLAIVLSAGPTLICCLPGALAKPSGKPWPLHFRDQRVACGRALRWEVLSWCVLPYTAMCHLDAIARAAYRVHMSGKKLLEWVTTSEAESRGLPDCSEHYRAMWACSVVSASVGALLAVAAPSALVWAGPVLVSWLIGPALAWHVSRPRADNPPSFTASQSRQARRWARQTWHYFEAFVNERDHWLPPDNVQEHPYWSTAHRTSPTNIAMGLLGDMAAHDLGHLATSAWLARAKATLHTVSKLDRYGGHLYNWYDTLSLQPIEPRYVSSVDSGNLWGALLVLKAGLGELHDRAIVHSHTMEGLQDTLEVIAGLRSAENAFVFSAQFDASLAKLREQCDSTPTGTRRICAQLCRIRSLAANLATNVPEDPPGLKHWTQSLVRHCAEIHRDVSTFAFWMLAPPLGTRSQGRWLSCLESQHDRESLVALCADFETLDQNCRLEQVAPAAARTIQQVSRLIDEIASDERCDRKIEQLLAKLQAIRRAAERAATAAGEEQGRVRTLIGLCQELAQMDFGFLFDKQRNLLSIGFNVSENRRDQSYYDLLASESRLASFLAIAHGQLPLDHWFALGRMMGIVEGEPVLLSWSGSMFEYLMPLVLMPCPAGSLLEATCRAAVRRQIRFARRQMVPFGISESCFNLVDANGAYQYRAFGVPKLGLDRSVGQQLVVAPYASALATMIDPGEAWRNLARLEQLGYLSPCGFYDAIEYTSQRPLHSIAACKTVMAHHSGMTLLAIASVLLRQPMVRRFAAEPLHAAYELLLQERVPNLIRAAEPGGNTPPRLPQRRG